MLLPSIPSPASQTLLSRLQFFLRIGVSPLINFSFSTLPSNPKPPFDSKSPKRPLLDSNHIFDHKTVDETLSLYSNDWKRALEFFNWVERENGFLHVTETYNRMIDILGKFFEFDLSWNLIDRMRQNTHSSPDHVTFRIMFKRHTLSRVAIPGVYVPSSIPSYFMMRERQGKEGMEGEIEIMFDLPNQGCLPAR